jgi:hypothetical protein
MIVLTRQSTACNFSFGRQPRQWAHVRARLLQQKPPAAYPTVLYISISTFASLRLSSPPQMNASQYCKSPRSRLAP